MPISALAWMLLMCWCMFEYIRALLIRPRCPKCGYRSMKPEKRTPPFPTGREPGGYKYVCPKCGAVVDLPPHILWRLAR